MATRRLKMKRIKELLAMYFRQVLSYREIGRQLGLSKSSVQNCVARYEVSGLTPEDLAGLDEEELAKRLYAPAKPGVERPMPDFSHVQREMRRKGVTLQLLWKEYRSEHPDGLGLTQFCRHFKHWSHKLEPVMRQIHKAGEKAFVDWSGDGVPVVDPVTGEVREVPLFVGVLGASGYTFACATESQELRCFVEAHEWMYRFFGGVPAITVPDNDRSAVKKADRFEPELNATFRDMARHYGTVVMPTRVRKPRDKAKVENAVLQMQRWILGRLRNHVFHSVAEVNDAIALILAEYNAQLYQGMDVSREDLWRAQDLPALGPLPAEPFEYGEWSRHRVHADYHVKVGGNQYSVPHTLLGKDVDVYLTARTAQVYHQGHRVASHRRLTGKHQFSTEEGHMPRNHQEQAQWTPERLLRWAAQTGPQTEALVERIMAEREHPEQGFRACMGVVSLVRRYDAQRVEKACERALLLRTASYKSVKCILDHGLENQPLPGHPPQPAPVLLHENIRGADHYQ